MKNGMHEILENHNNVKTHLGVSESGAASYSTQKLMSRPIRILLIEDNPGDAVLVREILSDVDKINCDMVRVDCLSSGIQFLSHGGIDLLLLDLFLPDSAGLDTLDRAYRAAPQVPIVVLTGLDDESIGREAVAKGAKYYLVKGLLDTDLLLSSINYSIQKSQ